MLGRDRLEVTGYIGPLKQLVDPVRLIERAVQREGKVGRVAQRNFTGQQPLQKPAAAFQRRKDFGRIRARERHYEGGRGAQIRAHSDFGDGYVRVFEDRVAAFTVSKDLRQAVAKFFANPELTLTGPHLQFHGPGGALPIASLFSHAQTIRRGGA
jgi:hypothetical protein